MELLQMEPVGLHWEEMSLELLREMRCPIREVSQQTEARMQPSGHLEQPSASRSASELFSVCGQ